MFSNGFIAHMNLDRFDLKLLAAVQADGRLTNEVLGERVGLSAASCQRRLKRLRDDGIILRDVAVLSGDEVGWPLLVLVQVSLERDRADIIDSFKRSIHKTAEIMSGYYVTGDADFVLLVAAENIKSYEEFTRRFFYENADIKGFKTMVVMDAVKHSLALPLRPPV